LFSSVVVRKHLIDVAEFDSLTPSINLFFWVYRHTRTMEQALSAPLHQSLGKRIAYLLSRDQTIVT
jgi:hypothetical protein